MKVYELIRHYNMNVGLQPWQLDVLAHEALMAEVEVEEEVDMEGYGPSGHMTEELWLSKVELEEVETNEED